LKLEEISIGDALPTLEHCPDIIDSFLYNAALWNAHRIHFDLPYATEVEGYPGLVVPGPLMGDWLAQCVLEWIGDDAELAALSYSNRQAAYLGEALTTGGEVTGVDLSARTAHLELAVRNAAGDVLTPGHATVRWP